MALTPSQLDQIADWCLTTPGLAPVRQNAWKTFFGENDPRPVEYWPGTGGLVARQRRFLGWFMFAFSLPEGRRPAELAAEALYRGSMRSDALIAVRKARYMLAIVRSVVPHQGVFLELEEERFEVRSRLLSQVLQPDIAVTMHVVPSARGMWLAGPGWFEWPVRIGPNLRRELKRMQPDPISAERLMQMRASDPNEKPREAPPRDTTLEAAVGRMTEQARAEGLDGLVMTPRSGPGS